MNEISKKQIILTELQEQGPLNLVELHSRIGELTNQDRSHLANYCSYLKSRERMIEGGTNGDRFRISNLGLKYLDKVDPIELDEIEPPATDIDWGPVEFTGSEKPDSGHCRPKPEQNNDLPEYDMPESTPGNKGDFSRAEPDPAEPETETDSIPELLVMDACARAMDKIRESRSELRRVLEWLNSRYNGDIK